jgi:TonB-linked SusC/RagA family outer membrane protein
MKRLFTGQRSIRVLLLTIILLLSMHSVVLAQSVLRGTIIDETTKEPLIGVVLQIKGTKEGTATNENGEYELKTNTPLPFTIIAQYAGYDIKEVEVYEEEAELSFSLKSRQQLSEVVVTAVGIESERKAITNTISEIKGDKIVKSGEPNVTTALSGKIAGVQVTNSGGSPGGASQIRIRGSASILGNNNPLYILDGVPIDNSVGDLAGNITNSYSLAQPSNRAIDINPNDIENITVLKGPAAAALYGIRAANGAIIINTKKGRNLTDKKLQVSVSSSFTIDEINRRLQPRQTKYSQGSAGQYSPTNQNSWGALLDTLTYAIASAPGQNYDYDKNGIIVGQSSPYSNGVPVNRYDNEKNFFVKGITQDYNINIAGRSDFGSYYASLGRLYQTGIIPTTDFERTSAKFNGDYEFTEKFKVALGLTYANDGSNNRALGGGYPTSYLRGLANTPVNFDITNGYKRPWEHQDAYQLAPTASKPWGASRSFAQGIGWDNPYWTLRRNPQKDEVNRFIAYTQLDYTLLPWLKATFRPGIDFYRDYRNSAFANGSAGVGQGVVNVINFVQRNYNHDFILSGEKAINKDLKLTVNLGQNYYNTERYQLTSRGDGLIVPDQYMLSNASIVTSNEVTQRKKLVALYGNAVVGYKRWLYVNLTGRNEWSSALPAGRNSFFYPSIGSSFIFSDALKLKNDYFTFGKLRTTYAVVGNDTDPYSLLTYYNNTTLSNNTLQSSYQGPFNGTTTLSSSFVQGNQNLRPEKIQSFEIGGELRFFKGRVGVDATYYSNQSKDQIIPATVPYSTGASAVVRNIGVVTNKGFELSLDGTPVENKVFSWDVNLIYYKNVSKVVKLAPGVEQISNGLNNSSVAGQPFGIIYGTDFVRNAEGKIIIDDNPESNNYGKPFINGSPSPIGNPNPRFNASLRNSLSYKAFSLSFLFDTRVGFDILNFARSQMVLNGVDASTESRGEKMVFEGVKASDGAVNDIEIVKTQELFSTTLQTNSLFVEKDLYYIKLRDVSITYRLPSSAIKRFGISAATLSLSARNFLLKTNYSGSDPDMMVRAGQVGSNPGVDFWTPPNTHSYGAAINIVF